MIDVIFTALGAMTGGFLIQLWNERRIRKAKADAIADYKCRTHLELRGAYSKNHVSPTLTLDALASQGHWTLALPPGDDKCLDARLIEPNQ